MCPAVRSFTTSSLMDMHEVLQGDHRWMDWQERDYGAVDCTDEGGGRFVGRKICSLVIPANRFIKRLEPFMLHQKIHQHFRAIVPRFCSADQLHEDRPSFLTLPQWCIQLRIAEGSWMEPLKCESRVGDGVNKSVKYKPDHETRSDIDQIVE